MAYQLGSQLQRQQLRRRINRPLSWGGGASQTPAPSFPQGGGQQGQQGQQAQTKTIIQPPPNPPWQQQGQQQQGSFTPAPMPQPQQFQPPPMFSTVPQLPPYEPDERPPPEPRPPKQPPVVEPIRHPTPPIPRPPKQPPVVEPIVHPTPPIPEQPPPIQAEPPATLTRHDMTNANTLSLMDNAREVLPQLLDWNMANSRWSPDYVSYIRKMWGRSQSFRHLIILEAMKGGWGFNYPTPVAEQSPPVELDPRPPSQTTPFPPNIETKM